MPWNRKTSRRDRKRRGRHRSLGDILRALGFAPDFDRCVYANADGAVVAWETLHDIRQCSPQRIHDTIRRLAK